MPDATPIRVNFGRPVPMFPLDHVALLPQQVLPLHIFEPRYRQMISRALDGPGQIAMATFHGTEWKQQYHGRPPVKPAVCLGQIVQHEQLHGERYNVLIQGVCRARIRAETPPGEGVLYRQVVLEPIESVPIAEGEELNAREQFAEILENEPMASLASASPVLQYLRNSEVPIEALLELVSFTMVADNRIKYRLLEEHRVGERARIIGKELVRLERLLEAARDQHPEEWPKGLSWN